VTARRHSNYRRALDLIAAVDPLWLSTDGRAQLEDRAEEMLLSRIQNAASISRLRSEVARSIREMVSAGLLPQPVADELTGLILAAGPNSAKPARSQLTKTPRAA
jgi:hypothetical protein